MSWRDDETQAFEEWRWTDRDQRAFLSLGLKFTREAYDQIWEQVGHEPSDGEDEWDAVFDQRVGGLWPHDYEWMHLAAVVRDAVTSFEVYVSKAAREVIEAHGAGLEGNPRWRDAKDVFKLLGVNVEMRPVKRVFKVRNVLTHQRGELRTEQQRKDYALDPKEAIPLDVIELNEDRVLGMLDQLGQEAVRIDAVAWRFCSRRERSAELDTYIEQNRPGTDS